MVICLKLGVNDLHTVQLMPLLPHHLASLKSRLVLPFWCQLTQFVLEKKPLNVRSSWFYTGYICNFVVWFCHSALSHDKLTKSHVTRHVAQLTLMKHFSKNTVTVMFYVQNHTIGYDSGIFSCC